MTLDSPRNISEVRRKKRPGLNSSDVNPMNTGRARFPETPAHLITRRRAWGGKRHKLNGRSVSP